MIYVFCRGLLRLIYAIVFPLKIVGEENVPKEGGVLLCANHISLLDPMTIGIKLDRQVKYMAKAELFEVPVLGWLINKLGNVMGIFPEGTRNSDAGVAKKGAASFALRSGAAVVPAAIVGEYKPFRRMVVVYGAPIDLSQFAGAGSESLEAVTDVIMERINEMKKSGIPTVG